MRMKSDKVNKRTAACFLILLGCSEHLENLRLVVPSLRPSIVPVDNLGQDKSIKGAQANNKGFFGCCKRSSFLPTVSGNCCCSLLTSSEPHSLSLRRKLLRE